MVRLIGKMFDCGKELWEEVEMSITGKESVGKGG